MQRGLAEGKDQAKRAGQGRFAQPPRPAHRQQVSLDTMRNEINRMNQVIGSIQNKYDEKDSIGKQDKRKQGEPGVVRSTRQLAKEAHKDYQIMIQNKIS